MPTLNDILADKAKYPDTQAITLADGVETTLGELRGGHMRQADYSRKTAETAREREALQRERQEFDQAKTSAELELQQLAQRLVDQRADRGQSTTRDEIADLMERDPIAKRLRDEIQEMRRGHEAVQKSLEEHKQLISQQQMAFIADQHRRALALIKSRDPEVDEAALVKFAQDHGIPRLDLAYRLQSEDTRMERAVTKAREDAAKESYEKAKRELAQPALPQRRVVTSVSEPNDPKTFDEAADRAKSDPDVLDALQGWSG